MATMAFNKFFIKEVEEWFSNQKPFTTETIRLYDLYHLKSETGAMFDARCFNIPKEEVCNLVYWRQLDATRNSIQMVGQANFSHNELQNKSCNMIQDMLMKQSGINWNDYETRWKRGVAWTKNAGIDYEIPILKGENRKYVDDLIYIEE